MTTLEAIYENGIFKPVSGVPKTIKEHEHVRLSVERDKDVELQDEIVQSGTAGNPRSAIRIVDETFGSTRSIKRKELILLAEDEEFSGY